MAEPTGRDRVWKYALATAYRNEKPVVPGDLAKVAGVSERTVRDCLLVIDEAGWLERRTNRDGKVRYVASRNVDVELDELSV